MKQIIIFLLLVILGFIIYDFYYDYKRFHTEEARYAIPETIDEDYYDQATVLQYRQAVEELDDYVLQQWVANGIDLRNPEDDDADTRLALKKFAAKKALVATLEAKLIASTNYKKQGLGNAEIERLAHGEKQDPALPYRKMIEQAPGATIQIGSKGALVFELQNKLVAAGKNIPVDGIYSNITAVALQEYEQANGLFPDGVLDLVTFNKLFY
ncbi:MAG: peptidoglycan-binding protein [Nonlabens sp.]|nr:peptidoglycan-binding protein [Nonlabens sp.]